MTRHLLLPLLLLFGLVIAPCFAQTLPGDDPPHWNEKDMDTAWLTFKPQNDLDADKYNIRFVSDNCYQCEPITMFIGNRPAKIKVSSQFKWRISLFVSTGSADTYARLDERHFKFNEYGRYVLSFTPGMPGGKLTIVTEASGVLSELPLIIAASVCVVLAFVYKLAVVVVKRRREALEDLDHAPPPPTHDQKPRLRSLDTFRGLSLFLMVFVNYGGGGYWFFNHAAWNGLTFADLLFPWFVWIMGAAIPFAFSATEKKKTPKTRQFLGLLRRSLTLALLGMFLNNGHDLNYWRLPGVLQRLGFSYLVIGTIYIVVPKLGGKSKRGRPLLADSSSDADLRINNSDTDDDHLPRAGQIFSISSNVEPSSAPACLVDHFSDIYPFVLEYLVIGLFVLAWFLVTFLLSVPGCPTGYLGAGGRSGNVDCTGGAAALVDRAIFSRRLIFTNPTCAQGGPGQIPQNYECPGPFDPEGLLGNLTSFFVCFLGLQAGRIMKTYQTHRARFMRLIIHGLIWTALGVGLCGASKDKGVLPLNKNLWSFSYVSLTGGLGFLLLAFCFLLIDWIRIWEGAPFRFVGLNSIVVYMGHELLENFFPFSWRWVSPDRQSGEFKNHWTATASNFIGASIWLLIAYILYRKKMFVRI